MSVTAGDGRRQAAAALDLRKVVDYATGSHRRAIGMLVVVALLCFLPGFFSIPPVDRDEARFTPGDQADGGGGRLHRHPFPG